MTHVTELYWPFLVDLCDAFTVGSLALGRSNQSHLGFHSEVWWLHTREGYGHTSNRQQPIPGTCPTNGTSIEFEIWPKVGVLGFKTYSADHNKILHMSRQLCKISLWLVENILNYSTPNFDRISNSIEIPFVRRALDQTNPEPEQCDVDSLWP